MNKGPHLSSILKTVEQQQLPRYVLVQSSFRVKLLYHRPIVQRFSMSGVMWVSTKGHFKDVLENLCEYLKHVPINHLVFRL
jgi:hypothetical protein